MLKARSCDYRLLNNLQQMHLKLLQKEQFKKRAEAIVGSISKKIDYKISKESKVSSQNR